MGKWIHRLSNKDFKNKTAFCLKCGQVEIRKNGKKWQCPISYGYKGIRNNYHIISNVNEKDKIGNCSECGNVSIVFRRNRHGNLTWRCGNITKYKNSDTSSWHRLSNINEEKLTATCSKCGGIKIKYRKGKNRKGYWACYNKEKEKRITYRKHLKDKCNECGFIPVNKIQMDIHHIDGNHKNNKLENLETLCACCHRLKHIV